MAVDVAMPRWMAARGVTPMRDRPELGLLAGLRFQGRSDEVVTAPAQDAAGAFPAARSAPSLRTARRS